MGAGHGPARAGLRSREAGTTGRALVCAVALEAAAARAWDRSPALLWEERLIALHVRGRRCRGRRHVPSGGANTSGRILARCRGHRRRSAELPPRAEREGAEQRGHRDRADSPTHSGAVEQHACIERCWLRLAFAPLVDHHRACVCCDHARYYASQRQRAVPHADGLATPRLGAPISSRAPPRRARSARGRAVAKWY